MKQRMRVVLSVACLCGTTGLVFSGQPSNSIAQTRNDSERQTSPGTRAVQSMPTVADAMELLAARLGEKIVVDPALAALPSPRFNSGAGRMEEALESLASALCLALPLSRLPCSPEIRAVFRFLLRRHEGMTALLNRCSCSSAPPSPPTALQSVSGMRTCRRS